MVPIVSSVLYLSGQKDLCSIRKGISFSTGIFLSYTVCELFYINVYFKLLSTIGDSACETLRNFKGAAFWILMLLLLEERMSVPCQ